MLHWFCPPQEPRVSPGRLTVRLPPRSQRFRWTLESATQWFDQARQSMERTMSRFDRHLALFGAAGQKSLRKTRTAVVGAGGLGSHVLQQLAYLGVGHIAPVDPDIVTETSLNRLVPATPDDIGRKKVLVAKDAIERVDPGVSVTPIDRSLFTVDARDAVTSADVVFGCMDLEGSRLALTELCLAFDIPYFDLASDVLPADPAPEFGGRVSITWSGNGCLVCRSLLDVNEAGLQLSGPGGWAAYKELYGVDARLLSVAGPSVVSVNGVIASLAVTEFMAAVTGLREPRETLTYRGWRGGVSLSEEREDGCYYCNVVRGSGDSSNWERYLSAGLDTYFPGSIDALASGD